MIFPKAIPDSRDMVPPSNHILIQDAVDRERLGLCLKVCLGQDHRLNGHWVMHRGARPGLASLGPCLVQGVGVMDHKIGSGSKA